MSKIQFSNLDYYVERFYSDLSTKNEESIYEYIDNLLFCQTMSNNSENSRKIFYIVAISEISLPCKEHILSNFYRSITELKRDRVLPKPDISEEDFIKFYTQFVSKTETKTKKIVDNGKENANYILETIFKNMISDENPNRRYLRYYVECGDSDLDEYYEKATDLIVSYSDYYKDKSSNFVDKLFNDEVYFDWFIKGEGFKYMKRIFLMWSSEQLNKSLNEFEKNSIFNYRRCKNLPEKIYTMSKFIEAIFNNLDEFSVNENESDLYVESHSNYDLPDEESKNLLLIKECEGHFVTNLCQDSYITLIVGNIDEDNEIFKESLNFCNKGQHFRISKENNSYVSILNGKGSLNFNDKNLKSALNKFFSQILKISDIQSIESTYIDGSTEHPISDVHCDNDEYGESVTLLLYPRVDNTLIGGRLRIFHPCFEDDDVIQNIVDSINKIVGPDTASYELSGRENILIINNRQPTNGKYRFICFNGNLDHQVEPHSGDGIREAVFYSLLAEFESMR